jgi:AcrR family transcriptional regulator
MAVATMPTRLGRPKGGSPEVTRERILDAAEALFAEGGYEGTSIRDIADRAAIGVAVVGYHFGPKEALFNTVIGRRGVIMNDQREHALRDARRQAGDVPIEVETLIRGYVSPFVEYARQGDAGWQNYAILMGRLANSPRGTEVIAKHYDATARAYIEELIRTLPEADLAALVEGFMTMVSAMLFICASTGRLQALVSAFSGRTENAGILDNLIAFNAAGFLALNAGASR